MHTLAIVCVAGLLLISGCATTPPQTPETARAVLDEGVQRVEVLGGSYWFRPARIIVKANTPVALTVRKQPGIIPHSFVINEPEAGISVAVALTENPQTLRFTPTRPGKYPYYCDVVGIFGSHRQRGMEGVLEVVR